MFERFSYYLMQALLVYYLLAPASAGGWGVDRSVALSVTAAYGGAVYLSTVAGAWVADRLLGAERTLFFSAVVVNLGYIALAIFANIPGFVCGLVAVALGSGGIKAAATTMVGVIYDSNDRGRDAGFVLFYIAINIGAFGAAIFAPWARESLGFGTGFGLAAIAMAIGLFYYQSQRAHLASAGPPNPLPSRWRPWVLLFVVCVIAAAAALIGAGVLQVTSLSTFTAVMSAILAVAYFVVLLTSKKVASDERSRIIGFIPMFLASVAFWSLFQQKSTTLARFFGADSSMPFTGYRLGLWTDAVNPFIVIVLAGILAYVWTKRSSGASSTTKKFASALAIMGIAFFALAPMHTDDASANLLQILVISMLFTCAELLISPVGLALATRVAPKAFQSQTVALFLLSIALGTSLASVCANPNGAPLLTNTGFAIIGAIAVVLAVAMAVAGGRIERLLSLTPRN